MGCKCIHSKGEDDNNEIQKEEVNDFQNIEEQNNDIPKVQVNENRNTQDQGQNVCDADFVMENNSPELMKDLDDHNNLQKDHHAKYANYPQRMVELINIIREDPPAYADIVEKSIENIVQETDQNNEVKLIFKKKVKVALSRGEEAFREAVEELRNIEPVEPLEFKEEICVSLPESEEDIRDPNYLKEQVKKLRENYNIDIFYKDLIKVPEISALLMVVDDSRKNPGRKRQSVLNKDFKYVGISSKFVGNTFVAYFTFSK